MTLYLVIVIILKNFISLYSFSRQLFIKNIFIGKKVILCKKNSFGKTFEKTDLRFDPFIFEGEDLCNTLIPNNQLIINLINK